MRLDPHWLNDSVKGFMSARGDFAAFFELDHLSVMLAQPTYLLAMKCMAMRIGEEFHDQDDVRYLLRLLDVRSYDQAIGIITKYYPLDKFPQKTLYALTDLLPRQRAVDPLKLDLACVDQPSSIVSPTLVAVLHAQYEIAPSAVLRFEVIGHGIAPRRRTIAFDAYVLIGDIVLGCGVRQYAFINLGKIVIYLCGAQGSLGKGIVGKSAPGKPIVPHVDAERVDLHQLADGIAVRQLSRAR